MASIIPFRWNLTRRKELGRHAGESVPVLPPGFERRYAARIVAFAGDADLCFIGRSAESFFDYLSGVFLDTSYLKRMQLLHFSMYGDWSTEEIARDFPGALPALQEYFRQVRLDPKSLRARARPVAFVDLVDTGTTMGNLMHLLRDWGERTGVAWESISPKVGIVGLTMMGKTSPKAWRWQQKVGWVSRLGLRRIKNVSLPHDLWSFLGNHQRKLAPSYTPRRWGQLDAASPPRDISHRIALAHAVALFDAACARKERLLFAKEMVRQKEIEFRWLRELVSELRAS
jgi:hypothetical protein